MEKSSCKEVLHELYEFVNLPYLAKNYFGQKGSWFYHLQLDSRENAFDVVDREKLKEALNDIATKIIKAAERL